MKALYQSIANMHCIFFGVIIILIWIAEFIDFGIKYIKDSPYVNDSLLGMWIENEADDCKASMLTLGTLFGVCITLTFAFFWIVVDIILVSYGLLFFLRYLYRFKTKVNKVLDQKADIDHEHKD